MKATEREGERGLRAGRKKRLRETRERERERERERGGGGRRVIMGERNGVA